MPSYKKQLQAVSRRMTHIDNQIAIQKKRQMLKRKMTELNNLKQKNMGAI